MGPNGQDFNVSAPTDHQYVTINYYGIYKNSRKLSYYPQKTQNYGTGVNQRRSLDDPYIKLLIIAENLASEIVT